MTLSLFVRVADVNEHDFDISDKAVNIYGQFSFGGVADVAV